MPAPLIAPGLDGWVNDKPLNLAPDRTFWLYYLTGQALAAGHSSAGAVEIARAALAKLESEADDAR